MENGVKWRLSQWGIVQWSRHQYLFWNGKILEKPFIFFLKKRKDGLQEPDLSSGVDYVQGRFGI